MLAFWYLIIPAVMLNVIATVQRKHKKQEEFRGVVIVVVAKMLVCFLAKSKMRGLIPLTVPKLFL